MVFVILTLKLGKTNYERTTGLLAKLIKDCLTEIIVRSKCTSIHSQ